VSFPPRTAHKAPQCGAFQRFELWAFSLDFKQAVGVFSPKAPCRRGLRPQKATSKERTATMSKEQMTIRLYPETRRQMDGWLEESNSKNRNEFVEKALRFYMGYLGTENITEFLSDALVATLRGIVADSANRTNSLLFKCAVEQGIMAHTIAAHFRDTMEDRRALRGYVVDEVKRTNGQIKFEDAQDVQRQLPDDTWLE
jgi:metal-responsive CopG/Arc/MetJ family transcriptional regulator